MMKDSCSALLVDRRADEPMAKSVPRHFLEARLVFGTYVVKKNPALFSQEKERIAKQLRTYSENLFFLKEVHGDNIVFLKDEADSKSVPEGDGWLTKRSDVCVVINTSDCLAITLFDPIAQILGIAHAGIEGTMSMIVSSMVSEMLKRGSIPSAIQVYFSPAIGKCCYDNRLNPQRVFSFENIFGSEYVEHRRNPRTQKEGVFLDIIGANEKLITDCGVPKENIQKHLAFCTCCGGANIPSYYREGKDRQNTLWTIASMRIHKKR